MALGMKMPNVTNLYFYCLPLSTYSMYLHDFTDKYICKFDTATPPVWPDKNRHMSIKVAQ